MIACKQIRATTAFFGP